MGVGGTLCYYWQKRQKPKSRLDDRGYFESDFILKSLKIMSATF